MAFVNLSAQFKTGKARKQLSGLKKSAGQLNKALVTAARGAGGFDRSAIEASRGGRVLERALGSLEKRADLAGRRLRIVSRRLARSKSAFAGVSARAVDLSAKTARLVSRLTRLSRRLPRLTRRLKGLKEGLAGAAATAAVMIGSAAAGGGRLVSMASNVREAENLFRESMGAMEASARRFSVEQAKALGVNEFELRRMIGGLNLFTSNMGIAAGKSVEMSQRLAVLSQDMASFRNADPNDVFVRLRSALGGSSEAVDQFGINLRKNALDLELQRLGLAKSTAQASEAQKVTARYSIILRSTAKDQGDLLRTSASFANQSRRLVTNVTVLGTKLGLVLLPAVEAVTRGVNLFLERIELNDETIRRWQRNVLLAGVGVTGFTATVFASVESMAAQARAAAQAGLALARLVRSAGIAAEGLAKLPNSPIPPAAAKGILASADALEQLGEFAEFGWEGLEKAARGGRKLSDTLQLELAKALSDNLQGLRASGAAARETGQEYQALGDSVSLALERLHSFNDFFFGQIQADQSQHQSFLQSFSSRFQLPSNPFAPSDALGSQLIQPPAAFDPAGFGGGALPDGSPAPGLPGPGAGIFPPPPEIEPYEVFFGRFGELLNATAPTVERMTETMGAYAGALGHATEALFGLARGGKDGARVVTQNLAKMGAGMIKDAKIRIPMHLALAAASTTGWGKHLGPAKDHLKAAAMFGVAAAFGGRGGKGGGGGSGGGSGSASGPEGPAGGVGAVSLTREGLLIQRDLLNVVRSLGGTVGRLTSKPGDVLVRDTFSGSDAADLVGDKGSADLGFAGSGAPPGGGGFNS